MSIKTISTFLKNICGSPETSYAGQAQKFLTIFGLFIFAKGR